jgi:hypothetical protein
MGVHRLRFSMNYQTIHRKDTYIARGFRATVAVPSLKPAAYLGIAWPETAWTVRTGPFVQNATLLFDFDLTNDQLALIENLRGGGGLIFSLRVLCEVSIGDDIVSAYDDVPFNVNQSAWIACMKQFGQDRIILLEVDIPAEDGALKTAVLLLKRARAELDAGNYDGVVQQCRRAIESVQKALKLKPAIRVAMQTFTQGERKKMTKRARALVINEAALHYSHPAHHVDEAGEAIDYGRRDATFMLALASVVVANGAGGLE